MDDSDDGEEEEEDFLDSDSEKSDNALFHLSELTKYFIVSDNDMKILWRRTEERLAFATMPLDMCDIAKDGYGRELMMLWLYKENSIHFNNETRTPSGTPVTTFNESFEKEKEFWKKASETLDDEEYDQLVNEETFSSGGSVTESETRKRKEKKDKKKKKDKKDKKKKKKEKKDKTHKKDKKKDKKKEKKDKKKEKKDKRKRWEDIDKATHPGEPLSKKMRT